MEFQAGPGARKILILWFSGAGVAAVTVIGALAGLLTPWLLLGCAAVGIATVILVWWYPPRYAARLRGLCDHQVLRAEKGVCWKKDLVIPLSSLRTVESWTTPLHRRYGCRTVVLRFAGGAAVLPLLEEEQAKQLARHLADIARMEDANTLY